MTHTNWASGATDADLELAFQCADAADAITMSRFRSSDLKVETKPDMTPVSDADRAVERTIRDLIARAHPEDAVLGEEFGTVGASLRLWILDPIDGTKNFVRGVPVWATLISLSVGDRQRIAVVSAPALGRRWWAVEGGGAWTRDPDATERRLSVSGVSNLADSFLSFSGVGQWSRLGMRSGFLSLTEAVWRTRAFGDFWSHLLVAEGAVDIACEPEVEYYDVASVSLIVTEAGGRFSALDGEPRSDRGSAVSSNGRLHDAALALLNQWESPPRGGD